MYMCKQIKKNKERVPEFVHVSMMCVSVFREMFMGCVKITGILYKK